MRNRWMVVSATVVGLLIPTGIAQALDESSDMVTDNAIDGVGKLAAHGRGHVEVTGSGSLRLKMIGNVMITTGDDATVLIRPFDADAFEEAAGGTTIDLEAFAGVIVVRGSDFLVSAHGRFRSVAAKGEGVALLQGRGRYRATGGYFGTWTGPGVRIAYSS